MHSAGTDKLAHSIRNTAALLDCGRTTVYKLLAAQKLQAVKLGGRTLVLDASVRALLAGLPSAAKPPASEPA